MPPQSSAPRRFSLEWASVWALCATIIIAAFVVLPGAAFPLVPTKAFVLALGALASVIVWTLARLARGNIIFPPALLVLALWLPTAASLLSALFMDRPFAIALWGTALEPDTLGFMVTLSVLGTAAALVVRRPDHYRAFTRVAGAALAASIAIAALVIILGQVAPNVVLPAFSYIGSPKDLAVLLGAGVIGILLASRAVPLASPRARALSVALAALLALLALLAVLNNGFVWILVAIAALGLFVEAIAARRFGARAAEDDFDDLAPAPLAATRARGGPVPEPSSMRSFITPLVVLIVSIFFLIGGNLGNALASFTGTGTLDVRPSWRSTLLVGSHIYARSPLFGSGPGSFGEEWLARRDPSLNTTAFWNVNFPAGIGFIPTAAVTTGALGALAWLALIGLFLFYGVRMLVARAPEDPLVQQVALAAFIIGAYFTAFAFLDLPGPVILALAFVALGVFASTARYARGAGQWGVAFARAPRLGFVIVFALTLLLLGSVGASYALIERAVAVAAFARANAAYAAGDLDRAAARAKTSLSFAVSPAAYTLEALIADAKLAALLAASPPPEGAERIFQTTISDGISAALSATTRAPGDYQAWAALGNLYGRAVSLGVGGAYESAKSAYDKALALNPTSPELYYTLAGLDIAHRDAQAAAEDLNRAIALKSDYAPAIFLLSQVLVAGGNVKDALAAAETAAYFAPADPNILFQVGVLRAASGDLTGSAQALRAAVEANPQFANARYFLAAVLARQGSYADAKRELEAVAAFSDQNAQAVASAIAALAAERDPFPPNLLTISTAPSGAPSP